MFDNILVPLDGSENAYKALEYAANIAEKFDSQITVLSVFRHHSHIEKSISMVRPREPENLDDVLSAYAKDIVAQGKTILQEQGVKKTRGFIKMGRASKKILDFAKKHKIDLIVISSKGQGDFAGYLLGGVSHKVAGLAKCPVMVI
ncbi:MAG: universal stress protein [Thermodesulfobacteriota bacterium]